MARQLRRLNTNMPQELVDRLDEYASKTYMSRSTAINVLIAQALDSQKAFSMMDELLKKLEQVEERA